MFQSKKEFLRTVYPLTLKHRVQQVLYAWFLVHTTPYVAYHSFISKFRELQWDQDKKHGPKS